MNPSCGDGRPRPSRPSAARQSVFRWMKFNAVGGIGIVVQLATLAVLRSWLKLDYLLATGMAVEIAVIHNFLWHERFTWADRPAGRRLQSLARLAKFNASNGAVSIVGNLVVMRLLVGERSLNYVASKFYCDRLVLAGEFRARRSVCIRCRSWPSRELNIGVAVLCSAGRLGRPFLRGP